MNWLIETYSNVYNTAMMQDSKSGNRVATAKERDNDKRSTFLGRFSRR